MEQGLITIIMIFIFYPLFYYGIYRIIKHFTRPRR